MNEILIPNADLYATRHQLEAPERFGSGKDGIVLVAKRKAQPAKVAIKVLRWPEAYVREKQVYERLRDAAVQTVLGFNVPLLLGLDDELRVIDDDNCRAAVRSGLRWRTPRRAPRFSRGDLAGLGSRQAGEV